MDLLEWYQQFTDLGWHVDIVQPMQRSLPYLSLKLFPACHRRPTGKDWFLAGGRTIDNADWNPARWKIQKNFQKADFAFPFKARPL